MHQGIAARAIKVLIRERRCVDYYIFILKNLTIVKNNIIWFVSLKVYCVGEQVAKARAAISAHLSSAYALALMDASESAEE